MARILIVGCGYVGGALARVCVEQGHRVFGMRRSTAELPAGVEGVEADVSLRASLEGLPGALDAVVYAVGAKARDEASYRSVYLAGLQNLLAALEEQGNHPARVLFTSSTSVYAQHRGEWVDEDSPTRPLGFSGQIQLAAEALLRDSPLRTTVLRLGGIYGPGRASLIERIRRGEPVPRRKSPQYTNRIHRDDAAGAIAHLLSVDQAGSHALYLGVDRDPADEVLVWRDVARLLGMDPPPSAEVETPARSGSKRCRSDRLVATGYRFLHPSHRDGYASLIAAIGDRREG